MLSKSKSLNKTAALFFTSYIIVMIVPLLISIVYFYPKMRVMLIENAAERSLNTVKQLDLLMDSQLSHVLGMPNHISTNKQIIEYDILNNQLSARTAQDQLSQIIKTNSFIEHLFLYMRDNSYLLSARTGTFFYSDIQSNPSYYQMSFGDISLDELQTLLDTAQDVSVMYSRSVTISGFRYNEMLLFIMPVPQGRHAYGSVLVCVPIGNIKAMIPKDMYVSDNIFSFIDHKGEFIYTTSNLNEADKTAIELKVSELNGDSGTMYIEMDGKTHLFSWSKSGKYGWQYVSTTPLQSITQELNMLQRPVIIITFGVILLSLLLIFIAMRINYSPIQRLASIAAEDINGGMRIKDDFQAIQQLIGGLLTDNNRLGERINQAEPKLKEYLVSMMVRGQWAKLPDVVRQAEQIDIDLTKSPYQVLLVSYENDQEALDALANLNAHEPKDDISVIVEHGDRQSQLIIIVSGAMEQADEHVLFSVLSEYRYLAIGAKAEDIEGISNSYNNAISALDYMELNKLENRSMRYDELPDRMFKPRNYPIEVIQALETTIQFNDYERIPKIIDQVKAILSIDGNAPYFTRSIYFNVVNLLITGLSRKMGEDNKTVLEMGMRLMMSHYTVSEMIDVIGTTADQLVRIIRGGQNRACISEILEYIENNINSAALSLQSAADMANMSASAFSRMFKEKTGRNFKEYVDGLRITYAKKLLGETAKPIEQIAVEVGYETVTSFYRLFKKHTGVAPGEYRQVITMKKA